MNTTFDGMILVIVAAIVAAHLPLNLPRLPRPFAARRARHLAGVKERARITNAALQKQAEVDAILVRVYAQAHQTYYDARLAQIKNASAHATRIPM